MDKIIPYSFKVEFKRTSLGRTINSRDEFTEFQKLEYIKEIIEENINPDSTFINLNKIGNTAIGVHEKCEIESQKGKNYIFIKFKVGKGTTNGLVVDGSGKIEYKIGNDKKTLEDYYLFLQFESIIDNNSLCLLGSIYLLDKSGLGLKKDFEDFFRNIVFNKKSDLLRFEPYLTKRELEVFKNDLVQLEFEGEFSSKNKFYNDSNLAPENRKKITKGIFIKAGLKVDSVKSWMLETIKNESMEKFFIGKPKGIAEFYINGEKKRKEFDMDTLLVVIKDDLVSTRENIEYVTFKNDCINYFFKLGVPVKEIN